MTKQKIILYNKNNEKLCLKCQFTLALSAFPKSKYSIDSHKSWCKNCFKLDRQNRKARPKTIITEKICNNCKIIKNINEFGVSSISIDGYSGFCKFCTNIKKREYKKTIKNAIKIIPKFKTCSCCNNNLKAEYFYTKSDSLDGLNNTCINCIKLDNKKRREKITNIIKPIILKKECKYCNIIKNIKEFSKRSSSYDGYCDYCKNCIKVRKILLKNKNPQYYIEKENKNNIRRKKLKNDIKTWYRELKNKPCIDCNKIFNYFLMEFDHINSDNKFMNVSLMVAKEMSRRHILNEISKCDLVCLFCHIKRERNRNIISNTKRKLSNTKLTNIDIVNSFKDIPCDICGIKYETYLMQCDHIDPMTKYKGVGTLISASTNILIEELLKCRVLCAHCHRTISHQNKYYWNKNHNNT